MAAIGMAVGVAGALASGRLLESRIWGVEPGDPAPLASAAILLATTALASRLSARRAGSADPVETLRVD